MMLKSKYPEAAPSINYIVDNSSPVHEIHDHFYGENGSVYTVHWSHDQLTWDRSLNDPIFTVLYMDWASEPPPDMSSILIWLFKHSSRSIVSLTFA